MGIPTVSAGARGVPARLWWAPRIYYLLNWLLCLTLLRRFGNRRAKRSESCQRLTVSQGVGRTALNHGDTEGTENDWETARLPHDRRSMAVSFTVSLVSLPRKWSGRDNLVARGAGVSPAIAVISIVPECRKPA